MVKITFTHQIIAMNKSDISSKNRFLNYIDGYFLDNHLIKIRQLLFQGIDYKQLM